jgi:hypothetical protein
VVVFRIIAHVTGDQELDTRLDEASNGSYQSMPPFRDHIDSAKEAARLLAKHLEGPIAVQMWTYVDEAGKSHFEVHVRQLKEVEL